MKKALVNVGFFRRICRAMHTSNETLKQISITSRLMWMTVQTFTAMRIALVS